MAGGAHASRAAASVDADARSALSQAESVAGGRDGMGKPSDPLIADVGPGDAEVSVQPGPEEDLVVDEMDCDPVPVGGGVAATRSSVEAEDPGLVEGGAGGSGSSVAAELTL